MREICPRESAAAALFGLPGGGCGAPDPLGAVDRVRDAACASIFIVPASLKQARTLGSDLDPLEFSDWSNAIPPTSTVVVAPTRDVGSFVWFTLRRPNYLALDQSAGVVFSRATALEIRRRSQVLLPLTDPTWKILSGIRRHAAKLKETAPHPASHRGFADRGLQRPQARFCHLPGKCRIRRASSYWRGRLEGLESL